MRHESITFRRFKKKESIGNKPKKKFSSFPMEFTCGICNFISPIQFPSSRTRRERKKNGEGRANVTDHKYENISETVREMHATVALERDRGRK